MEDLIKKREQELIKEGLNNIDSFGEYTSKNKPDIYKEYLDLKEEIFINRNSHQWCSCKSTLEHIKKNLNYKDSNEDLIKEMEIYVDSIKPKILFKKEYLNEVNTVIKIINRISESHDDLYDKTRLNYCNKVNNFLKLETLLRKLLYEINLEKNKKIYKQCN